LDSKIIKSISKINHHLVKEDRKGGEDAWSPIHVHVCVMLKHQVYCFFSQNTFQCRSYIYSSIDALFLSCS